MKYPVGVGFLGKFIFGGGVDPANRAKYDTERYIVRMAFAIQGKKLALNGDIYQHLWSSCRPLHFPWFINLFQVVGNGMAFHAKQFGYPLLGKPEGFVVKITSMFTSPAGVL
ncbi:MAG: hypothetical protein JNM68_17560 [Dinghuibacter sp.]|nr:hypothetical protein [Dinghuibacter sp.]